MSFSDIELLKHIDDELTFISTAIVGKQKDEVIYDPVLSRALVRSLEIIGEAAKKISSAYKSNHTMIDWKKIAGTRDKLIHHYFGIDYDIVWDIIENKLPDLKLFISEELN